jgi:hypothetical protein
VKNPMHDVPPHRSDWSRRIVEDSMKNVPPHRSDWSRRIVGYFRRDDTSAELWEVDEDGYQPATATCRSDAPSRSTPCGSARSPRAGYSTTRR